jgi:hypothetical protein
VRWGAGYGHTYDGAVPGNAFVPGTAPPFSYRSAWSGVARHAVTLTAAQAALTAAYSVLLAPYRAEAADRVAVRAPL